MIEFEWVDKITCVNCGELADHWHYVDFKTKAKPRGCYCDKCFKEKKAKGYVDHSDRFPRTGTATAIQLLNKRRSFQ